MSKFARVVIYCLRDPRDQAVRYVGKTAQTLSSRLRGHLNDAKRTSKRRVCQWISELTILGLAPEIEVLEETGEGWPEREVHWIEHFLLAGADLTNVAKGGFHPRGWNHSEETKAAMSIERKARWKNPEFRQKTVASLAKSAADPEVKARRVASIRKIVDSEQWRANVSKAQKKKWSDPEFREASLARLRISAQDPEVKMRTQLGRDRVARDPDVKAKKSASAKRYLSDPVNRRRRFQPCRPGIVHLRQKRDIMR